MPRGKEAVLHSKLLEDSKLARQIVLERECMEQGVLAYRESVARITEAGEASRLKAADPLFHRWFGPVCEAIRSDMRLVRKHSGEVGVSFWGPIFAHFGHDGVETMAGVALHETISLCTQRPEGVRVATLAYHIGRDLLAHRMLDSAKETAEEQLEELREKFRDITARLVYRWGKKTLTEDPDWERKFCTHAGMRVLWHVVCNCDCSLEGEEFQLAFHHKRMLVKQAGGRMIRPAFIVIDDRVLDAIDDNHARRAASRPRYTFMLIEPMPWTKKSSGNYVKHKTSIFTKSTREQQEHAAAGDLSRVFEATNAINDTPLRINLWILGIQQEFWSRGGNIASIPRADDVPLPTRDGPLTDEEKQHLRRERWRARQANRQLKADRIVFQRTLGVAERFASESKFYSPNLLDYRGRFYARPLYLNHNGDDLRRGLIEFANRKDPGETGRKWLRVHAANTYGIDKVSFRLREEWVDSHASEIERCVRDPIGEEFWRHADDPWQFLAACRALVDDEAACHLPTQWDGSANGLQHYTAMGRDAVAAPLVNLTPGDEPGNVYQAVADIIRPTLDRDARQSDHVLRYSVWEKDGKRVIEKPVREIAAALLDVLSGKLVKHPVMTSVYGVTSAGAREQILAKFAEMGYDRQARYEGAAYLSRVVLDGIGELCSAASKIMGWITDCARAIAKENKPVCWTSPIGLPVLQPYRRYGRFYVETLAGRVWKMHVTADAPIAVGKQTDGAAPNFVHSVDASHAMMTGLRARRNGIDTLFNHDSDWTHAADKERLDRIIRKTFVELHSEPLLERLHAEFQSQTTTELPPPPPRGDFDLNQVMQSPYFFH